MGTECAETVVVVVVQPSPRSELGLRSEPRRLVTVPKSAWTRPPAPAAIFTTCVMCNSCSARTFLANDLQKYCRNYKKHSHIAHMVARMHQVKATMVRAAHTFFNCLALFVFFSRLFLALMQLAGCRLLFWAAPASPMCLRAASIVPIVDRLVDDATQ